ncbi:MAG: ATP-dependent DNA ligase, partial [Chloroflexota bacterium]
TMIHLPLDLPPGRESALPGRVEPMMPRLAGGPFDSTDYLFEIRWDGIRALAAVQRGRVQLTNPRLGDITHLFPELLGLSQAVEDSCLLDGEVVLVDGEGQPDFDGAQRRLRAVDERDSLREAGRHPACFLAFDLLHRRGRSLLGEPLIRRKKLLAEVAQQAECLYVSEYFEAEGRALLQAAEETDLEGIVARAKGSRYIPGSHSGQWLAVRRTRREHFVVGGYTLLITGQAETAAGGSDRSMRLLLGALNHDGELALAGTALP